jgi:hypothetical protein
MKNPGPRASARNCAMQRNGARHGKAVDLKKNSKNAKE